MSSLVSVIRGRQSGSPQTTFTLSSNPVAFGKVNVNTTASKSITVTNTGGQNLVFSRAIDSTQITGVDAAMFKVASTTCNAPIAPRGKCSITLSFTPTSVGNKTATLTLTSNATVSPLSVGLTATGR